MPPPHLAGSVDVCGVRQVKEKPLSASMTPLNTHHPALLIPLLRNVLTAIPNLVQLKKSVAQKAASGVQQTSPVRPGAFIQMLGSMNIL